MKAIAIVALFGSTIALAGCTAASPEPASTVTVTASPTAAVRGADTPIDSYDAWYICRSAVFEAASGVSPKADDFTANDYDPKFISEKDGAYTVQIIGTLGETDPGSDDNASYCVVSGTIGAPSIDDYLYPR